MTKPAEDIISLPIELNSKMADSKFRLVHIAAQRVRELTAGSRPLVESRSIKDTTIALEESLLAPYRVITGEAAQIAREERRKMEEQVRIEEQLSAKEEEIRKELSAYLTEAQTEEGGEAAEGEAEAPEEEEAAEEEEEGEDNGKAEYTEE